MALTGTQSWARASVQVRTSSTGSQMATPSWMSSSMFDDFCVFGRALEDLEIQIKKLIKLSRRINLKLAPSKFSLSTSVKFGGTIISAEKNSVIFVDPPDSRILAVTEMEAPNP